MSKKVLFLVYDLDSASGICVQKVASELYHRNMEVFILTKSSEIRQPYDAPYGAKVYSVLSDTLDRWKEQLEGKDSGISRVMSKLVTLAIRARVVLCYPVWPLNSFSFSRRFAAAAKKIAQEKNIHAVIPVYNTIDALIAADALKKENVHIKNIPYLLDAFYGGQTPKLMSEKKKRKKALWWEKKLFHHADGVVMMRSAQNSYGQDGIAPAHLEKTVFLDIPMLCLDSKIHEVKSTGQGNGVFLFAGSMPRNIREPKALLNIFQAVEEPGWQLHLAGNSDFEDMIADAARTDPRIHRLGRIPYAEAQRRMEQAQFLVNIGNTLSYMVPSKIFEYMSFNKPIISTYKISDDPCLPYLRLYGKACLLDEREDPRKNAAILREFVQKMEMDVRQGSSVFELAQPGMPLYENTPAAFADFLIKIMA